YVGHGHVLRQLGLQIQSVSLTCHQLHSSLAVVNDHKKLIDIGNILYFHALCSFLSYSYMGTARKRTPLLTHHYNLISPDCNGFFSDLDFSLLEQASHRPLEGVLAKAELRPDQLRIRLVREGELPAVCQQLFHDSLRVP